jgi:N-acetylneuraminic acid mutarotase
MPTDELARRLQARAQQLDRQTTPVTLDDVEAHAPRTAALNRHRLPIALLAAVVVVAVAVGVVLAIRPGTPSNAPVRPASGGPIAPSPLTGRVPAAYAWTGSELVIWGGAQLGASTEPTVGDGAAYDPITNRWHPIAASPLSARAGATSTWTGTEMFVWGGVNQNGVATLADGALYSPATNRWRRISAGPLDSREYATSIWTGHEVIVFGGNRAGPFSTPNAPSLPNLGDLSFYDAAAYNPTTDTWRQLPNAPLTHGVGSSTAAWTGREMIVANSSQHGPQLVAYSPTTNRWRHVARPPLPRTEDASGLWTGTTYLRLGHPSLGYDPSTNRWHPLAAPPTNKPPIRSVAPPVWTGHEVLWPGATHSLAYNPNTNTWRTLDGLDITPRYGPAAVWTGDQLIVWGGISQQSPQRMLNDGTRYTP